MNNIYIILKEYLELQIGNLKQDKSNDVLKLYDTINLFLNTPKGELSKLDNDIHEVICTEIFKNDQPLVNKYRLLCAYSSFIDNPFLNSDPQIIEARRNYEIILERLTNLLKNLESKINEFKRKKEESQALISVYENYLTLFNESEIQKGLEIEELNGFFEFLKSSAIDKKIVLDLVTEFSKFNITYQLNSAKLRTSIRIKEIEANANEVAKEFTEDSPGASKLETIKEFPRKDLTKEETDILNRINIIISGLKGVLGDDSLLELLDGEFTIDGRKEIYEAAGKDKWKLIYEDIIQNLLPNFEKNKDDILTIFEYIINTYTGKNQAQEEKQAPKLDIEYEDILKKEEVRINKYLDISKKSRFIYESYDENQQKFIDIAYSYLQKGDQVGLNSLKSDIPLTDIVFMKNLEKLKSLISDWQVLKEFTYEEIISYGIEEYKESIKENSDNITSLLDKLDKNYEEIQSKVTISPPEEKVESSNNQENYVVFLNDDNGVPLVLDTVKNVSANDSLVDVYRSIDNITKVNYYEFMSNYITSYIQPMREPQMYKVRRGNSRVAFIQVPISSSNREKIGREFNNSKRFNLVLIVNFGFKYNDSKNQSSYDKFNRIYDVNFKRIMQIFELFGNDFNKENFKKAQKMLLDGIDTVEELGKISKNREKKGV